MLKYLIGSTILIGSGAFFYFSRKPKRINLPSNLDIIDEFLRAEYKILLPLSTIPAYLHYSSDADALEEYIKTMSDCMDQLSQIRESAQRPLTKSDCKKIRAIMETYLENFTDFCELRDEIIKVKLPE